MRIAHLGVLYTDTCLRKIYPECVIFWNSEVFPPLTYGIAFKDQGFKRQLIPSSQVQAIRDCFIFLRSHLSKSTQHDFWVLFREHKKLLMEEFRQKIHIHQKNHDVFTETVN